MQARIYLQCVIIRAPSACVTAFLKIHVCSFIYANGLHKLLKFLKMGAAFKKFAILVGGHL
jgi:hypothetical protein